MCSAQNSFCLVYLPQEINDKLTIETVTDADMLPKIASYEILITPIVRIVSESMNLSSDKPAIIELVKTIELSDNEFKNKVIPLYSNLNSSEWKELVSESNCKVLNDRISFEVTHLSHFAVISRKPCPSSTIKVKPSADISTPDQSSTHTELTIPELPGFKVQIPLCSVNADREVNVTATVLYDCSIICNQDEKSRLASSCIELEPHGITFSKEVFISVPIPDYAEVMKNDPDAQLQIWHTNKCSNRFSELDWQLVEHSITQDKEGRFVAVVLTEHFSLLKLLWNSLYSCAVSLFYDTNFGIKERCQVFMSQEARLPSEDITFSIAVLFYPYKEEPEPIPCNYKYTLLDSGLLDLSVSNNDALQFEVKLNEHLCPKNHKSIAGSLVISGHQQQSFIIELDGRVKLQGNFPMGELSIGIREHKYHTLTLIKVRYAACAVYNLRIRF